MSVTTEPVYWQTWGIPVATPRRCHAYHHDVVVVPRHATRALATAADLVRDTAAREEHLIVHMSVQVAQSPDDPARGRMQITARHISDSPATLASLMMGIDPQTAPLASGEGSNSRTQQAVSLDHVLGWAVSAFRQGVEVDALDDFVGSTLAAPPGSQTRIAARAAAVDQPVIEAVWLHLARCGVDPAVHWVVEDDLPVVLGHLKEALENAFVVAPPLPDLPPLGTLGERLTVIGRVTDGADSRAVRTADGYLVTGTTSLGTSADLGHPGDVVCVTGTVVEHARSAFGPETAVEDVRRLA